MLVIVTLLLVLAFLGVLVFVLGRVVMRMQEHHQEQWNAVFAREEREAQYDRVPSDFEKSLAEMKALFSYVENQSPDLYQKKALFEAYQRTVDQMRRKISILQENK